MLFWKKPSWQAPILDTGIYGSWLYTKYFNFKDIVLEKNRFEDVVKIEIYNLIDMTGCSCHAWQKFNQDSWIAGFKNKDLWYENEKKLDFWAIERIKIDWRPKNSTKNVAEILN